MGGGILSGLLWGSALSVIALGVASQLAPLPETRASETGAPETEATLDVLPGAGPDMAPSTGRDGAGARLSVPEADETPERRPEPLASRPAPAGETVDPGVSAELDVPAGSEFRRGLTDGAPSLPEPDGQGPSLSTLPVAPQGSSAGELPPRFDTDPAGRPDGAGSPVRAPLAPEAGEDSPALAAPLQEDGATSEVTQSPGVAPDVSGPDALPPRGEEARGEGSGRTGSPAEGGTAPEVASMSPARGTAPDAEDGASLDAARAAPGAGSGPDAALATRSGGDGVSPPDSVAAEMSAQDEVAMPEPDAASSASAGQIGAEEDDAPVTIDVAEEDNNAPADTYGEERRSDSRLDADPAGDADPGELAEAPDRLRQGMTDGAAMTGSEASPETPPLSPDRPEMVAAPSLEPASTSDLDPEPGAPVAALEGDTANAAAPDRPTLETGAPATPADAPLASQSALPEIDDGAPITAGEAVSASAGDEAEVARADPAMTEPALEARRAGAAESASRADIDRSGPPAVPSPTTSARGRPGDVPDAPAPLRAEGEPGDPARAEMAEASSGPSPELTIGAVARDARPADRAAPASMTQADPSRIDRAGATRSRSPEAEDAASALASRAVLASSQAASLSDTADADRPEESPVAAATSKPATRSPSGGADRSETPAAATVSSASRAAPAPRASGGVPGPVSVASAERAGSDKAAAIETTGPLASAAPSETAPREEARRSAPVGSEPARTAERDAARPTRAEAPVRSDAARITGREVVQSPEMPPMVDDQAPTGIGLRVLPLTERTGRSTLPPEGSLVARRDADVDLGGAEPPAESQGALERNAIPFEDAAGRPQLSVVLLDDGTTPPEAISGLYFPVTVAVDPASEDAAARAASLSAAGAEVVIMASGLPKGARPQDLEISVEDWLTRVPSAIGVMDTEARDLGADEDMARQAISALARGGHGLLLHDTGLGGAARLAGDAGLPSASLWRRIDVGEPRPAGIGRALDRAAFEAGRIGGIVVSATMAPDTLEGLGNWALAEEDGSVVLAPLSAVLADE
ncbi:divergent polysaccharide deacetylase family protein [Roseicyclus sp. F158]|uniref:Divergent polysaccharide deacetylase family protein n=1 Tax=Tropicimonas omnivorans TaxID=3075590 RepID=A0ABU3DGB1_9RHOB|nr:divergent polysaccharide deacetylase family protein [Roseicyclus sp. F158]MDT0682729.1 divergent polysaccharide deacetylase family protein [Roseicyclus sp. F158]